MFTTRNDRSQWAVIYDRLVTMAIDEVIKDAELAELVPEASTSTIRNAFIRATREMEQAHSRTFTRVRMTGYRMVQANEHAGLAKRHHRRASRQLRTAWRKAHAADRSLLTRTERQRIDDIEISLAQQREITARLDRRLKQETRERKSDVAQVSEQVVRLTQLLERHGINDNSMEAAS